MSTFNGIVKEYPFISIDHFMPSCNFKSTVFFLSHCHWDHMKGLNHKKFFELLESRGFCSLYVSDVSEHLLKNDKHFHHLKDYIVSLALEEPTVISVPDRQGGFHSKIVVTLLSAGHCPGSVMFLIEGNNGRVLYTGDFRLPVGGSARLTKLHDENGELKPIDSLYVDTTFCSKKYLYFPSREKCLSALFNLVEPWLKKGPNHIIAFDCPAQYNYEYVFVKLFEKFKQKVHVSSNMRKKYKGIKSIEDAVTSVPTKTQIHACFPREPELFREDIHMEEAPCGFRAPDGSLLKVMILRPCAMSFHNCNDDALVEYDPKKKVHKVCFSTHSSLAEVRDMVLYLKPKIVYPNVIVKQTEEEILDLIYAPVEDSSDEDSSDLTVSPLGPLKVLRKEYSFSEEDSLPFFDEHYEIPKPCYNANTLPEIQQQEEPILSNSSCSKKPEETQVPITKNVEKNIPQSSAVIEAPKQENSTQLEWKCPLFSNDENLDPNSSFSSSQDIFEMNSNPCDSEEQTPEFFNSPESKTVLKSSSPKDSALLIPHSSKIGTSSVNNNTLFLEKYSSEVERLSPKNRTVLDKIVTDERIMKEPTTVKSNNISSERTIHNPLELLFSDTSSDITQSGHRNSKDCSTPCDTKDAITIKETAETSRESKENISVPNSYHVVSNHNEKSEISVSSSILLPENVEGSTKSCSKDGDYDQCKNSNSVLSSVKEGGKDKQTMHIIGKPRDSEVQSSLEDLIFFTKLIDEMSEHDQKQVSDNSKKSVHLSKCNTSTTNSDIKNNHSVTCGLPLTSNFAKTSEVSSTLEPINNCKQIKPKLNFSQIQTKTEKESNPLSKKDRPSSSYIPNISFKSDCNPKLHESKLDYSQTNQSFLLFGNSNNSQPSHSSFKPNPLKDVSISKFEKSLLKVKKKATNEIQNDDADDIMILNILENKQTSDVEIIDLSSDDSEDELSIIEDTLDLIEKRSDIRNFRDTDDLERFNPSPSILTANNIQTASSIHGANNIQTINNIPTASNIQTSSNIQTAENIWTESSDIFVNRTGSKTTKRKSNENEFMFIKCLRTETSVGHAQCYNVGFDDSTPEDLPVQRVYLRQPSLEVICVSDNS